MLSQKIYSEYFYYFFKQAIHTKSNIPLSGCLFCLSPSFGSKEEYFSFQPSFVLNTCSTVMQFSFYSSDQKEDEIERDWSSGRGPLLFIRFMSHLHYYQFTLFALYQFTENKQTKTHTQKNNLNLPCQYLNTSFLFCFQWFLSASSIKICKLIPGIAAQTTWKNKAPETVVQCTRTYVLPLQHNF